MFGGPTKPWGRARLVAVGLVILVVDAVAVAVTRGDGEDVAAESTPSPTCDGPPTVAATLDLADGILEVFRIDPGEAPVPLRPDQTTSGPTFSPDGRRIAVILADGNYESSGPNATSLTTMAPDGNDVETVMPLGPDLLQAPAWSPDGRTIALVRIGSRPDDYGVSLVTVPVAGGEPTVLHTVDAPMRLGAPAWSPDGTRLAFATIADEPDLSGTSYTVWVIDARGGTPRQIATVPFAYDLDWSPDVARLLVGAANPNLATSLVDVETGRVETVDASRSGARWSTRPNRIVSHRRDGAIVEEALVGTTLDGPVVLLAPDDFPPSDFSGRARPAGQMSVAPCPP